MILGLTTVTQKGQVTLPKKLRDKVGIKKLDKVRIEQGNGYLKVIPTQDILEFAGIFKPKAGKSVLKARQKLEQNYLR